MEKKCYVATQLCKNIISLHVRIYLPKCIVWSFALMLLWSCCDHALWQSSNTIAIGHQKDCTLQKQFCSWMCLWSEWLRPSQVDICKSFTRTIYLANCPTQTSTNLETILWCCSSKDGSQLWCCMIFQVNFCQRQYSGDPSSVQLKLELSKSNFLRAILKQTFWF